MPELHITRSFHMQCSMIARTPTSLTQFAYIHIYIFFTPLVAFENSSILQTQDYRYV